MAQAQTPANGDAARGAALFQLRCSDCHGVDAKGVHGPDLTVLFANGATDGRVFETIRRGVPGTEMPRATRRTTNPRDRRVPPHVRCRAGCCACAATPPTANAVRPRRARAAIV